MAAWMKWKGTAYRWAARLVRRFRARWGQRGRRPLPSELSIPLKDREWLSLAWRRLPATADRTGTVPADRFRARTEMEAALSPGETLVPDRYTAGFRAPAFAPDLRSSPLDSLVSRIRAETRALNRNNVTRTEAYRAVYRRHPELHWALVAHMVSRNGGWNMTDLQGELLPRLLTPEQRRHVFRFLETANSYIFGDAYPQLLLYDASVRAGRDLSGLLSEFGVSRFMIPVWRRFWQTREPAALTAALIVNEQHFIEKRVVRNPLFREQVLESPFFRAQAYLQMNQVVFPYRSPANPRILRLAGLVLEDFGNLEERIRFGKQLYALLFGVEPVRTGAIGFALSVRHTGSRADYWPHLFARERTSPPDRPYRTRLAGHRLKPGADRLYSPALEDAWPDQPPPEPKPYDWLDEAGPALAAEYALEPLEPPARWELAHDGCEGLRAIELAVAAAQALKPGRQAPPG
ncbi:DUF2515 family protein [Paenibacillus thermoaerophilus]|uniref:DUF2515 family protein n=1 Tax=Paenibacillus thermoaerophilus TaxID=1215385 RepID=A0ABW2V145_9BACL|nr:DUF2515 family protein [Paenibacillus thermoaerophilus]